MSAPTRTNVALEAEEEFNLPEGWVCASLFDVTERVSNINPQTQPDHRFGYVDISSIDSKNNLITESKHFKGADAPSRARRPIRLGDVLFSNVRTYLKNIAMVSEETDAQVCSTGFTVIRANAAALPKFLFYYTLTDSFVNPLTEQQTGSNYPATSDRVVLSSIISLAPLVEQKRLVCKIEELFKQVSAGRERLARVPRILKAFRQSVLAAACSGRLTEDWRENGPLMEFASLEISRIRQSHESDGRGHGGQAADPTEDVHTLNAEEFPESWAVEELKWLCKPGRAITYGILKPGPNMTNGVPYIRVADFPGDRMNLSGIRRTSPKIASEYRRSILKSGDVLLSIRGTVGRVCRVPEELDGANITQDTARISVHSDLSADYIELYLKSPTAQKRLERAMKGVAVRGVNIGDVRVLQIAVPPLREQHEIVRRVQALFKLADMIEKRIEGAAKRADSLAQAILGKAFRGELVPTEAELARREGRDYEPASVLLNRIRKERERPAPSSNGRKAKRK